MDQRASVETQLRNSHAEELATLQAALERERSGRKKEVNDLKARHSAEIKQLSAEHTRKVHIFVCVCWGVGVGESDNNIILYTTTFLLAKSFPDSSCFV